MSKLRLARFIFNNNFYLRRTKKDDFILRKEKEDRIFEDKVPKKRTMFPKGRRLISLSLMFKNNITREETEFLVALKRNDCEVHPKQNKLQTNIFSL